MAKWTVLEGTLLVTLWCTLGTLQKFQVSAAKSNSTYKCEASELDKLDEISARIMSLSANQRPYPDSRDKLDSYCKETKHDLQLMGEQYNKCLTGTSKQFGSIIHYSMRNTLKQFCGGKQRKRADNLIEIGKCINQPQVLTNTNACLTKYIDLVQRAKRGEPRANRIGYSCCDYYKLLTCIETATKEKCTTNTSQLLIDVVRQLFSSIVDVACGDFTEQSDKCDRLKPLPKRLKSDKKVRSFFLPLVELWTSV